ncbi:SpoIIE family protein phosphatase [Actinokineospora soli]|uniref:SpoIIE family protein phosphatase n=1 Tax=Actinokineospora soli TaxID=1048753 RepID=A0ABW2TR89_9PSEU
MVGETLLAFSGPLADDDAFAIVLTAKVAITRDDAERFGPVALSARAGLLAHGTDDAARREALADHLALLERTARDHAAELEDTVRRLRNEAALVDTLRGVGLRLTSQLDLDSVVQDATDAAVHATGAAFGAFFYNLIDEYGESYTLYTLSGVSRERFAGFPMPRNTELFSATFHGKGTVRSDDVRLDPRFGKNAPYRGTPPGHLPVCSYLAVSVISPTTREVLGGFFFAHPDRARFTARHQQLAEGIAGYAAVALDNARLFDQHRTMATKFARSMLPTAPQVPGLDIVARYLPAAHGADVGGDWFDVIELPAGRAGLVIGDVVGRGVTAAAIMGQMRTAVRSFALLDLPPAQVLARASALAGTVQQDPFITCLYVVHDPMDDTLTYANAGHLPGVLLTPDGGVSSFGDRMGMPLGVGDEYTQRTTPIRPGARFVLFTDGLVESRTRGITEGVDELVAHLRAITPADAERGCDLMIDSLTGGSHSDDVALLHVHYPGKTHIAAAATFPPTPRTAADARAFVGARLAEWGLHATTDTTQLVASELVTNAVQHGTGDVKLRLRHIDGTVVIDVSDHGTATPRVFAAGPDDECHRGLAIVEAVAEDWGTRPLVDGKVVWAEIKVAD